MTALLAVLALVFGVLTIAAPAGADPPDSPGNSENAPGQNKEPPGQADKDEGENYNPGASHDKMTICHYVEGKGETKAGYNIITMSVQAWQAHLAHHPDTMDVVYNGVSCPTVPEPSPSPSPTPELTPASLCNLTVDPPAMYTWPDNTSSEYLAALDEANTTGVAWALTCPTGGGEEGGGETAEAAAVTAVEAATVEEEATPVTAVEAGTVAETPTKVTLPATVATPATQVPAGDGSSVPTIPVYALALLALGAMTLAASTVRLVKAPTS